MELAVKCGYSDKGLAEEYIKENPKTEYTTDDFINLYHMHGLHWKGCATDKGLRPVYGVNGKTTAINGIAGNSGPGQDWR